MRTPVLALLTGVMAVAGCSLLGPGTVEALRDRGESADGCRAFDSLDDLLHNTRYRTADGTARALTVAVVVGRFDSVAAGRAFVVPGGDVPGGQAADFDADGAVWKTLEATFTIDQVISGNPDLGGEVAVGIALGPDANPDRADRDLPDLGTVVLFLDKSPVFAYDRDIYGTTADGSLITVVSDEGKLSLPARSAQDARDLLSATPTLDSLAAAASRPARTLVTDPTGCQVIDVVMDGA